MANPVAAHTFGQDRYYVSTRDDSAPGSGVWTTPTVIFDTNVWPKSTNGDPIDKGTTFCAGGLTEFPRGLILNGTDGILFCGDGLATQPILVTYPGLGADSIDSFGAWTTSFGAWSFGGAYYVFVNSNAGVVSMLRSTDNGNTWTQQDQGNTPQNDGQLRNLQRLNDKIYVFCESDGTSTNFKIFTFNLETNLWETPSATVSIPSYSSTLFGVFGWSNGLMAFANGDIGIVYNPRNLGVDYVAYRLYSAGTWGAEVVIPGATFGAIIIDPSGELLHVFNHEVHSDVQSAVHYSTVSHVGVVVPNIFIIPARTSTSDGIGHCSSQNNKLFVPWDQGNEFDNAIWVANISDGQFFKESLPIPIQELGQIAGSSVGSSGGSGYTIGDTFTVNGGTSLARGHVTSVSGGAATGIIIDYPGYGYSVASGVATTHTSGGGSGLTINITQLSPHGPSCAYMMFPNGYSLSNSLAPACPINNTAQVGVPYSGQLQVSGGTPPYTWKLIG